MNALELQHEVDRLLLHIRGLVAVSDLLERRGASEREVRAHREEIDRLRDRLARLISDNRDALGAAA
jgi:hypothetical protein